MPVVDAVNERNGTASAAAGDDELDEYLLPYMLNRGVMITPFHNTALMCPVTSQDGVNLHTRLLDEAVAELVR
jgi:glutamate-1-semialdehyde 2,1-aminomutase